MPMNGSYLLDTNIVIGLFANDAEITRRLSVAFRVAVPAIVMGELYYGAFKSSFSKANIDKIDSFALRNSVIACDIETSRYYGQIKDHLRTKGKPIPENDIWIAAVAKQHNMILVSRDQHFETIKEIKTEKW